MVAPHCALHRATRLHGRTCAKLARRLPGDVARRNSSADEPVAEEALGIRSGSKPSFSRSFLRSLRDVALDHVLLDLVVEDAVDRVEDLGLGDAAAAVGSPRYSRMRRSRRGSGRGSPSISGSRPSMKMRIAPISADCCSSCDAAADRRDARQDLADVDRLADDVVDAGLEQHQRVLERVLIAERDHRRTGAVADPAGRHDRSCRSRRSGMRAPTSDLRRPRL